MPSREYLVEDHFSQHLRSIEIEKDGNRNITFVNGRKFNNFVVDIGGASLLTALRELENSDSGVLVIDPKTFDISANLMVLIRGGEVNSVQEVFERFYGYSELTEVCELSIESYTQALAEVLTFSLNSEKAKECPAFIGFYGEKPFLIEASY